MAVITVNGLKMMYMKKAISTKIFWQFKKLLKRRMKTVRYQRQNFVLNRFTNSECMLYFRFTSDEILVMLDALKIPKINRLKNRTKFVGVEGLCLLLRRLSFPNRLCDLTHIFQRDNGSLCAIIKFMLRYVYMNYATSLHSLQRKYLSQSTLQELADYSSDSGCPYPNVIGYIDGTCREICRPTYNQRDLYSGYTKSHTHKYQSVMLTNGLIGRLDGPFIGRRHDSAIVHLSRILNELQTLPLGRDGINFEVYGDSGYSNQKYVKVGFKNRATLNEQQTEFNRLMSTLRIGVEYGFGQITTQFAFLDFKRSNKMYLSELKKYYYVATFLTNCQSCLRGRNQISAIFESNIPTLEEYLAD